MIRSRRRSRGVAALTAVAALTLGALASAAAPAAGTPGRHHRSPFVERVGSDLHLKGKPFRFAGTNNYYLHYKSPTMRNAVLEKAADAGFDVVRTWGWFDIGNEDGSNSTNGPQDGTYVQFWDPAAGRPAYNDGPSGLEKLDAVIAKAGEEGLKLVIPFTGNWDAFGGMDQYVLWAGQDNHDDFYSDPQIRGWFKDWITHLLNRTNTITGLKYKDDPTVMTWELANEPRCGGSGRYPRSADGCNTDTMTEWANDISTHIKRIDRNHLVSVGDEGFLCWDPALDDEQYDCRTGVDTERFAKLKNIDVMSYHLYPDHWGKDPAWGERWIREHIKSAQRIGKPEMLGEFGLVDKATRNPVYKKWTDTVSEKRGDGALYWILSDVQDDGSLYPDFDGFTVYCPSPVCTTLSNFATRQQTGLRSFAPVADVDAAVVEFGESATLPATANDIAYAPARIVASSLDLDPATAGVQSTRTTAAGTWSASGGTVTFSPIAGWSGRTSTTYAVRDSRGRLSNVAALTVNGRPEPGAAVTLFDFEDGTQGWAGGSWQTEPGTVSTTTDWASDGVQALHIDSNNAWFVAGVGSLDWTGKSVLSFEMSPTPTSVQVSIQTGSAFDWCEIRAERSGTSETMEVDLASATCGNGFVDVRALNIFISTGSVNVDAVRIQ